ncbi:multicopy suppressor of ts gsp1 [Xylographa soralifera]|nr:multicopy suppressor of ts gsp1 [Xylographa soralifera]
MASFKVIDLYDGSIQMAVPTSFIDASNLRPVPDNQEVYVDANGTTSIVVELLDRVNGFATDEESMKYHIEDLAGGSGDTIRLYQTQRVTMHKLHAAIPAYTMIATAHPVAAAASPPASGAFTGIYMIMVRLVDQKCDVIVTINVPHDERLAREVKMEEGRLGQKMEEGATIRDAVVASFWVKNWGLFGQ